MRRADYRPWRRNFQRLWSECDPLLNRAANLRPHTVKQQASGQRPAQTQCLLLFCVCEKIKKKIKKNKRHICFSFPIKKTLCVDVGITQRSAINNTFVPGKKRTKGREVGLLLFLVRVCLCVRACGIVCFPTPPPTPGFERQLRKQGRWIFFGPPGSSSGGR